MTHPLRVCLDARQRAEGYGGIGHVVVGLARALSALTDGDEEYLFLTFAGDDAWLRSHVRGPCRIVEGPRAAGEAPWKRRMKAAFPRLRSAYHRLVPLAGSLAAPVPGSDGTLERSGAEVMHFTSEDAFRTAVPSIYQPWDLQHLHFPQYFTPRHRLIRERRYRSFCGQARRVVVGSSWARRDLLARYGLPPERVRAVPLASVLPFLPAPADADLAAAKRKYALPDAFAFYPARTWPHKNHTGLLEALAILRDQRGLVVPLVASGALQEYFPVLERRMEELRLREQVRFTGFVGAVELRSLYRLCRCLVFPSRFEGFGLPLVEAFEEGVPVACSAVASLPEVAGDAALLFDPGQPAQIADALHRLWTDPGVRETLVRRGRARASRFTWDRTARTFRACYREIAGRPLTDEDRALLEHGASDLTERTVMPRTD